MKFVKLTDTVTANMKDIGYVRSYVSDDTKYRVEVHFRGRYRCLTWTFNTSQEADSFHKKITDLLINESNSSNGGK